LLRNANVFQGFIDWSDVAKLSDEACPKFASYELNEGDIVLSLDRPLVSNGLKVARLKSDDVPSLLLQRVGRFLLSAGIDSNFLYTFLNSDNFINSIKGHDQSLGVPHISPSQVENIEIPIPPTVEEQIKIAERLNEQMRAVAALKKSLTDKLAAVKKLPAALLRKAFAGEI
jgi:type I restriction enzyme S subunit